MPGQGKKKQRQGTEGQRPAARTTPDAGRWEVVVETVDSAELRVHVRRLQEAGVDGSMIRIDTLCGRLKYPSGYRLSRFVTDPAGESDKAHPDD